MNRNKVIVVLIALLVVFNLVKWWPNTAKDEQIEKWQEIKVSELTVNGADDSSVSLNEKSRNLFYDGDDVLDEHLINKPKIKKTSKNKSTNTELSGIKLIGVIFKNNHYESFVSQGEEKFNVSVNDYIGRRYKVKKIDIKSIRLKDMQTGRLHEIIISDE